MSVRILEEHVVNQIAAGEVVERPASVVRELVQNALDAGAKQIRVDLRDGGAALVRVVDDGSGMNRTDAMMALERHATSKIHFAEDLTRVATLGFRGEAIPSIAAVSRFELRTRPAEDEAGTRIRIEGGTLRDVATTGCAPGTEVDVRSLFYNVPARRKFLRTRQTELSHCLAVVTRECLSRPAIDWEVRHDEREVLRAPTATQLTDRVIAVLGDVGRTLVPVDETRHGLRLVGLCSPVGIHRAAAANSIYLYVNGRFVTDRLLRRAVYEAYRERVPRGRYPLVVLDVQVAPHAVDVNVHPTKTEVRFTDPRGTGDALQHILRGAIDAVGVRAMHGDPSAASAAPGPLFRPPADPWPPAGPTSAEQTARPRDEVPAHPDDDPRTAWSQDPATSLPQAPVIAADPASQAPAASGFRQLELVGPLGQRWLLCAAEARDLVVVDLQAAAERLILAHRDGAAPLGPAQRLLAPVRVGLTRAEADRVEAAADALAALQVDVDRFGPAEVALRGVPQPLLPVAPQDLLRAVAAALEHGGEAAIPSVLARLASRFVAPPEDDLQRRTLLATLDEAGVPVAPPVASRWTDDELAERTRGGR